MPRFTWHARVERTCTRSMFRASIRSAMRSSISSPRSTTTSLVLGSMMSEAAQRPMMRSRGAGGGDEVLEPAQALAEAAADREVDDAAGRVGHETAHPGHLPDLRDVPL